MLDIFKKNHEEPSEENVVAEPPVQPEPPQEPAIPVESPKIEESLMATLQGLKDEETALQTEKSTLINIEEQLKQKALEEIEKTKQRIEGLKAEIPELKQRCEGFAKALEIPVYNKAPD